MKAPGELIGRVGVWFPAALRQAFDTLGVDHVPSVIHYGYTSPPR